MVGKLWSHLQFGTELSRFEGSYKPSEFLWHGGTETCHWSVTLSYSLLFSKKASHVRGECVSYSVCGLNQRTHYYLASQVPQLTTQEGRGTWLLFSRQDKLQCKGVVRPRWLKLAHAALSLDLNSQSVHPGTALLHCKSASSPWVGKPANPIFKFTIKGQNVL